MVICSVKTNTFGVSTVAKKEKHSAFLGAQKLPVSHMIWGGGIVVFSKTSALEMSLMTNGHSI